jgi:AraC-like DNA-binding protein
MAWLARRPGFARHVTAFSRLPYLARAGSWRLVETNSVVGSIANYPEVRRLRADRTMEIPITMMKDPRSPLEPLTVCGVPHVLDLGLVRGVPGHPRRQLDFWVFGMILNGTVGVQVGTAQLFLGPGDYYILPEHVVHFGLDESLFDVAFFHFVLPGVASSQSWPAVEIEMCGKLPKVIDYQELYRFIEQHFRRHRIAPGQIGVQLTAIMQQISLTQRHRGSPATTTSRHLGGAVLDLLQSHYSENLSADEISRRLGYSYSHLERAFRKEFRTSIHQQLLRVRINAATHGLQMGKAIKEVAMESGFRDYYYFLKAFKRLNGVTPHTFQDTFHNAVEASGVSSRQDRPDEDGAGRAG